jgi:hypothetical protein
MIVVRVMEEEQYRLYARYAKRLDRLDEQLTQAVHTHDRRAFAQALHDLHAFVKKYGKHVPHDEVIESDIIIPAANMTLAEVEALLAAETVSPGKK